MNIVSVTKKLQKKFPDTSVSIEQECKSWGEPNFVSEWTAYHADRFPSGEFFSPKFATLRELSAWIDTLS